MNTTAPNPDISRLESLISGVSDRLNQVGSLNDTDSIKFGGIGSMQRKK